MAVEVFANDGAATVVSGGTTAPSAGTVETWTLTGSSLPAVSSAASPPTQCYVADTASGAAETEKILVTNISGATATVTRGADGTVPVAHASGFIVAQVITRASLEAIQGVGSVNGLTGSVVLQSSDGTVAVTVSGQDINFSVNGASVAVVIPGTGAPSGGTGFDGDYYIDFAALNWYGPKASGAWPSSGGSLSGGGGGGSFYGGLLGDGSDGAVTFDGTTANSSIATLTGSTYVLHNDLYTTALTVSSGVTVLTNNCTIFCTGTVTNNGTIANNGQDASGATSGGITTLDDTDGLRSLYPGSSGGAGSTGAGANSNGPSPNSTMGGSGGAGGDGSGGAGAGTQWIGLGNIAVSVFRSPYRILSPFAALPSMPYQGTTWPNANNVIVYCGAQGGGSGGGDGTNSGGGGGGGAGIVAILAYAIANAGTISANGGAGGTPPTGNCGGGGGGGGGVVLTYSKTAMTGSGSIETNGGAAGSSVGTGTAGTAGVSGWSLSVVLV